LLGKQLHRRHLLRGILLWDLPLLRAGEDGIGQRHVRAGVGRPTEHQRLYRGGEGVQQYRLCGSNLLRSGQERRRNWRGLRRCMSRMRRRQRLRQAQRLFERQLHRRHLLRFELFWDLPLLRAGDDYAA